MSNRLLFEDREYFLLLGAAAILFLVILITTLFLLNRYFSSGATEDDKREAYYAPPQRKKPQFEGRNPFNEEPGDFMDDSEEIRVERTRTEASDRVAVHVDPRASMGVLEGSKDIMDKKDDEL